MFVPHLFCRDSTRTVSGTVSARNNVGLVRSLNIFVPEPEHAIRPTKIGVSPMGKVGISKGESERRADERKLVPNMGHLTKGCLKRLYDTLGGNKHWLHLLFARYFDVAGEAAVEESACTRAHLSADSIVQSA